MVRFAQPPVDDDAITTLALQLAAAAAAALERIGVPLTMTTAGALSRALAKALEDVRVERERSVRQDRIEGRASWIREQRLLSDGEAAGLLRLTLLELETARDLAIIAPEAIPAHLQATSAYFTRESWRYYLPSITLTASDRACIAHETLLTRPQAAERLGMSVRAFDQLRLAQHLPIVDARPGRGNSQPTLYRTDDVLRLSATMEAGPAPQSREAPA